MTTEDTRLAVHAHPGGKINRVIRCTDEVWHIRIAAPPVEGKANRMLIEYLSSILGVNKSRINVAKGTTGRRKLVIVKGIAPEIVQQKLKGTISP